MSTRLYMPATIVALLMLGGCNPKPTDPPTPVTGATQSGTTSTMPASAPTLGYGIPASATK